MFSSSPCCCSLGQIFHLSEHNLISMLISHHFSKLSPLNHVVSVRFVLLLVNLCLLLLCELNVLCVYHLHVFNLLSVLSHNNKNLLFFPINKNLLLLISLNKNLLLFISLHKNLLLLISLHKNLLLLISLHKN